MNQMERGQQRRGKEKEEGERERDRRMEQEKEKGIHKLSNKTATTHTNCTLTVQSMVYWNKVMSTWNKEATDFLSRRTSE